MDNRILLAVIVIFAVVIAVLMEYGVGWMRRARPAPKISVKVRAEPPSPQPPTPEASMGRVIRATVVKHKPIGRVGIWRQERTVPRAGGSISQQDAWVDYLKWCREEEKQHLPREKFLRLLGNEATFLKDQKLFENIVLAR